MAYKIGEITLNASWDISGNITADQGPSTIGGSGKASLSVGLGILSASVSVSMTGFDPNVGADPEYTNVLATVSAGNSTTSEWYQQEDSLDLSGSASMSIPCDIVFEYDGTDSPQPFALGGVVDSPPYRLCRIYLVGNGNATASISCARLSASSTVDVRGEVIVPKVDHSASCEATFMVDGYVDDDGMTVINQMEPGSASLSATVTTNIPSGPVPSKTASATETLDYIQLVVPVSASGTGGAGGVSVSCTNGKVATALGGFHAVRNWNLSGVVRAMEQAYPDSITVYIPRNSADSEPNITVSGGSFSRSATQQSYSVGATAETYTTGDSDSASFTNFSDIVLNITPPSLSALGDQSLATRLLLHGKAVNGMVINQAASYTLEDFTSGSWLSLGEADLTLAGGVLTIDTAANPGGASRSYSPERSTSGYRYLRVRLRSVGSSNIPVTVSLGGYGWTIQSGADGVWSEAEVDLCAPGGVDYSDLADGWDTRWPLPTQTSVTSGPFGISGISINSIPAGVTVELDTITLVRHSQPTVDLMPTFYSAVYHPGATPYIEPEWPLLMGPERPISESGTVSQDYVRRCLLVNTDGRQSIEEPDFWYTRTEGGATGEVYYFFHHLSIGAMVGQINAMDDGIVRWGGWSATASVADPGTFTPAYSNQPAPAVPYYYNETQLLATELHGGGAFYTHTNGWQFGFDRPTGMIRAQPLFDAVRMCGMEGDAFGHGGGAPGDIGSLTLVAAAILRAGAHGLVFQEGVNAGQPAVNAELDMLQNDTVVSTGTSRAKDGWYHMTSLPYAKTPVWSGIVRSAEWQPEVDPEDELPQVSLGALYTRHRHRASLFAVTVGHTCCSLLTGPRFYLPFASSRQGQEGQAQRGQVQQDPTQMSTRDWRRILPETVMPTPEEEFTH